VTKGAKKAMFYGSAVLSLIAAFIFLSWAIQTAWLGSFPDRDVQLYSRWAAIQLGGCVFSLVVALIAFVFGRRVSKSTPKTLSHDVDA